MDSGHLQNRYEYERNKLQTLCDKWQRILDSSSRQSHSEDTKGAIMAVLGQTKLLLNKKLKQFEELLQESGKANGEGRLITLTDLEGFWEVVMIQVNDVLKKFSQLEQLNVCEEEPTKVVKTAVNSTQRRVKHIPKSRGQ